MAEEDDISPHKPVSLPEHDGGPRGLRQFFGENPSIMEFGFVSRQAITDELARMGWWYRIGFDGRGPLLDVCPQDHGIYSVPLPVNILDDHAKAWDDLLALVTVNMIYKGKGGTA